MHAYQPTSYKLLFVFVCENKAIVLLDGDNIKIFLYRFNLDYSKTHIYMYMYIYIYIYIYKNNMTFH